MNEQKWLIVRTNSRAEKLVAQRLTDIDIENYLPIRRILKHYKDRKKWVDEILIRGYVFVNISETDRKRVFDVGGITSFLFVNKKIAIVTEKEIELLKIFCKLDEVKIEAKGFEIGDAVEVIDGILIGMRGVLQESQNGSKLSVYIEALGLFAKINIKMSEIRKI